MAFNTSRRGAAERASWSFEVSARAASLVPAEAGDRNAALAIATPFALGERLGSGDGASESLGAATGSRSMDFTGALGGGGFVSLLFPCRYG